VASVHRDPRSPEGIWYCYYRQADGQRAIRSTGQRDKEKAQAICSSLQTAENEGRNHILTQDRVTELIRSTLRDQLHIPETGFFTYLIQSSNWLKIGVSIHLHKRMTVYEKLNPAHKLIGLRQFESVQEMLAFEKGLHGKFAKDKKNGTKEWFHNLPQIRKAFADAVEGQLIYLNYLLYGTHSPGEGQALAQGRQSLTLEQQQKKVSHAYNSATSGRTPKN
jgi:hypothetical protein